MVRPSGFNHGDHGEHGGRMLGRGRGDLETWNAQTFAVIPDKPSERRGVVEPLLRVPIGRRSPNTAQHWCQSGSDPPWSPSSVSLRVPPCPFVSLRVLSAFVVKPPSITVSARTRYCGTPPGFRDSATGSDRFPHPPCGPPPPSTAGSPPYRE